MVVAGGERTYRQIDEGPIRRVRRTRSPNADDSSSSHSGEDDDNGIRIGPDYQADIPEFSPENDCETKIESMLVWTPHPESSFDSRIDKYSSEAKEMHGYNLEQALGMLFWHKHSIDKARADLANFTPFPDEWSVEDRALFEQALGFHGKCFHKIQQMLPDKSVGCLVKYYYSWKKTRSRTSLIDHQANRIANSRFISDDEMGASSDSEDASKENAKKEPRGVMSRAGLGGRRVDGHSRTRNKRKPPRGMYLNQECLTVMAAGPPGHEDTALRQRKADLVELKRQVQNNKQALSVLMETLDGGISLFRIPEGVQKINGRWTNEELLLAVQGVRRYGKDFKAIAEVIGNKTESLVRSFFVNYRRRYNLDEVLAEYEKENGKLNDTKEPDREETPMDVDKIVENGNGSAPEQPDSRPSADDPAEPKPLEPKPSAPELSTSEPKPLASKPSAPELSVPESLEPKPSAPELSTPKPLTSKPSTPESLEPKPLAPELSAPEPSAPKPSTSKPLEPKPLAPEPSDPEPLAPEPSTPEPLAPEPLEPLPSADDFASSSSSCSGNHLLAQDSVMLSESVATSLPASIRACDEGNSVDATAIE